MRITVSESYEEMSKNAASFLVKRMARDGKVNIGLATGNTPTGMYEVLVEYLQLGMDAEHVHYFNIDEYCGITGTENGTCQRYLHDNFYDKIKIPEKNIHLLKEESLDVFESEIRENGGLDTIILGIGKNGHIAYNEPGTAFGTVTHTLPLTHESKLQHSEEFGGYDFVPDRAVTMGIKTIMNAKNILLVANGSEKASILRESLIGPITEQVPASILQLHPNLYVFTDAEAGEELHI